ncbi:MAG: DUF4185 domain-containing protein [Spirochaetes bacterium]|nr:DUF4185 domain-containing protein [Spirochaetota bacterium]
MATTGLHNSASMGWNKIFIIPFSALCICLSVQCNSKKVVEYGVFAPSRLAYVKGQDGCTPIDFDKQYTMWTFGDTITDDGMISNSLAFTQKVTTHNVAQLQFSYYQERGKIVQFIKNEAGEDPARDRLWAFDGIRIGDTVYVYFAHVYIHDAAAPLSFTMKESSLAYWKVPFKWQIGNKIQFIRKKNMFTGNVPAFGASVLESGNFVYVVGHISEKNKSGIVIARVDKNSIIDQSQYEFLQGDSNWNNRLDSAIRLYGDVAGECSLSYDDGLQSFCMVYCQLFTGNIIVCMSKTVEGLPTAQKYTVYMPPRLQGSSMMYYSAKAIAHDSNQWYIVYMNPMDYQPYLIKVDVEKYF